MGSEKTARPIVWLSLAVLIMGIALIRVRLADVPLERDEGEYAYAGQLMLDGVPPFAEAYNMKMPGIYAAYAAVLAVFGQTHRGIHLGLLAINLLTTILFFLMCRQLFEFEVAALSAAGFALLSLTPAAQGMMANAEHFVLLFAICALFVLLRGIDSGSPLLVAVSGLLFGVAFLMKQHGAFLFLVGCVWLLQALRSQVPGSAKRRLSIGGLFAAAALVPFALTCLILWRAGVFERFWFWTFDYGRTYVSQVPFAVGARLLFSRAADLVADSPLLWAFAGVGLLSPLWIKHRRQTLIRVYAFLVLSFLATCPGLFFRPHYFVLFLPAVALLGGIGMVALAGRFASSARSRHGFLIAMIGIGAGAQFLVEAPLYFMLRPAEVSRRMYGGNPFPESLEVARQIRDNSTEEDRVAVLGSEPQIYFYSQRRSATGYIYMYPLMERHEFALNMQKEMIEQIESTRPKYVVFVAVPSSWLVRGSEPPPVFEWAKRYLPANYERARTYTILSNVSGMELWEAKE